MSHKGFILGCTVIAALISVYRINVEEIMQNDLVIEHINNKHCRRKEIKSYGPEDVASFNDKYLITVTSGALEIWDVFDKDQKNFEDGGIYLINPVNEEVIQLEVHGFPGNVKFHGHGIYVRDKILYVINHAYLYGGERVEQFEIDDEKLVANHLSSFELPSSFNGILNDLIVIDEGRSFIATSFHAFTQSKNGPIPIQSKIETAMMWGFRLKITSTYTCRFDNGECHELPGTKGIMNNGITWNRSLKNPLVYVVDTTGRSITIYKLKNEQGKTQLIYVDHLELKHMVDNIEYSVKDNIIYASFIGKWAEHVNFATYLSNHKKLPSLDDPSIIFHSGSAILNLNSEGLFNKHDPISILNFNSLLRAGSGVFRYREKIVYGSWCDNALVFCDSFNSP